jgi:hypothetical protein
MLNNLPSFERSYRYPQIDAAYYVEFKQTKLMLLHYRLISSQSKDANT